MLLSLSLDHTLAHNRAINEEVRCDAKDDEQRSKYPSRLLEDVRGLPGTEELASSTTATCNTRQAAPLSTLEKHDDGHEHADDGNENDENCVDNHGRLLI